MPGTRVCMLYAHKAARTRGHSVLLVLPFCSECRRSLECADFCVCSNRAISASTNAASTVARSAFQRHSASTAKRSAGLSPAWLLYCCFNLLSAGFCSRHWKHTSDKHLGSGAGSAAIPSTRTFASMTVEKGSVRTVVALRSVRYV